MRREYKLAADPIKTATMARREILQITDDGDREVFAVVPDYCSVDVLEAIRRAYQDGREDNAPHYHGSGQGEPCYCPSPATYAPQGNSEYGTEEEQ